MEEMKKKKYGKIVNIGSIAGGQGSILPGANYTSLKACVLALTKKWQDVGQNMILLQIL